MDYILKVSKKNISTGNWINYVIHKIKEEQFQVMDHPLDNEIKYFIVQFSENDNVNNSCDQI